MSSPRDSSSPFQINPVCSKPILYPFGSEFTISSRMVHIPGAFDRDNDYGLENRDHEFSTEIDYRSSFDADKTAANREFSLINSSSIINATSANSVSGPSSPPPDQPRPTEFSPPTRPSSTPYLQVAASDHLPLAEPDMEEVVSFSGPNREFLLDPGLEEAKPIETCGFSRLPVEIHEEILNYIFGSQYGAQSCPSVIAPRNVSTRRFTPRDISDLALVGGVWRSLIQSRIYRHVKLKGTAKAVQEAENWFSERPHLAHHIKHLEVWFPVFQSVPTPTWRNPTIVTRAPQYQVSEVPQRLPYNAPDNNCSLEEVFLFMMYRLPNVKVLSLEGGDRRKAPKVQNLSLYPTKQQIFVPSVQILATRGQWNLIRKPEDFTFITNCFPNLREWHGSYSKQKSKTYITMGMCILPYIPTRIKTLNIRMESEYRRERASPPFFFYKVLRVAHMCPGLGNIAQSLENLTYTGRICRCFFDELGYRESENTQHSLKAIDITVKNVCRFYETTPEGPSSGTGIQDALFIQYFESLVLSAVQCLGNAVSVNYLRIRYVDLDSIVPPLNPYFLIQNNECTGVWSNAIISELQKHRPKISFPDLDASCSAVRVNEDGIMVLNPDFKKTKIKSFKLSNYAFVQQALGPL